MLDPSPHVLWGREHADYDPLRLVLPEHEDYGAFSRIEAAPSPDTGAIVHYYKRRFRGYLRFDHEGRGSTGIRSRGRGSSPGIAGSPPCGPSPISSTANRTSSLA